MSLSDLINSHATSVFLNAEHFAETVTHRPLGVAANDATLTAVWIEDEPHKEADDAGERVKRTGTLFVAEATSVNRKDQWLIGDDAEPWQTLAIRGVEGGLRQLMLQRDDIETHKRTGGLSRLL